MEYLQYKVMQEVGNKLIKVLNLIINGIPSILEDFGKVLTENLEVLNLIINGIPSIHYIQDKVVNRKIVLNLIINGIPSILYESIFIRWRYISFKPYYKWNTFNTANPGSIPGKAFYVLNLIINGIPSIPYDIQEGNFDRIGFKPYYKWNTFNTKERGYVEKDGTQF